MLLNLIANPSQRGAQRGAKNAGGTPPMQPQTGLFYPSNCSVILKIGVNIMFLLPVCFC
jgi:hypothetical protein